MPNASSDPHGCTSNWGNPAPSSRRARSSRSGPDRSCRPILRPPSRSDGRSGDQSQLADTMCRSHQAMHRARTRAGGRDAVPGQAACGQRMPVGIPRCQGQTTPFHLSQTSSEHFRERGSGRTPRSFAGRVTWVRRIRPNASGMTRRGTSRPAAAGAIPASPATGRPPSTLGTTNPPRSSTPIGGRSPLLPPVHFPDLQHQPNDHQHEDAHGYPEPSMAEG